MLILKNYRKTYNGNLILQAGTLKFPEGLIWIKGLNGSGKTTLLKSIAGIVPFEGDILLDGLSQKKDPVKFRRLVTYSEAEPEYPIFLTGAELIGFTARTRKVPQNETDVLTAKFGIEHYFNIPCGGYSAGMVKKISLCMAFLGRPSLVLLDEPFAFIDQEATEILTEMIRNSIGQTTRIIITSHHDPSLENLEPEVTYRISDSSLTRIP